MDSREAPYARKEVFEVNRNHTPEINKWLRIALALFVLHVVMYRLGYATWQPLVLSVWADLPAMGMFLRAEALVRRTWGLWVKKTEEKGITPDAVSKRFVLEGNILGLLFAVMLKVLAIYEAIFFLTAFQWILLLLGVALFVAGAYRAWQATEHEVRYS